MNHVVHDNISVIFIESFYLVIIVTGSTVEESIPKRGGISVEWKWFDAEQITVICEKYKESILVKT